MSVKVTLHYTLYITWIDECTPKNKIYYGIKHAGHKSNSGGSDHLFTECMDGLFQKITEWCIKYAAIKTTEKLLQSLYKCCILIS